MEAQVTVADKEVTSEQIIARIERMPFTWWQVRARIVVGSATFFDGLELLTIASVLPVLVPEWKLRPEQVGLLISAGFAGQLVGGLVFGWLAERYGRLRILTYTVLLFSLASLATAFANGYWTFFVLRTIQGVGLGPEIPVAAAYINEISGARKRGRFFLLYQMIFGVGNTCAGLLGWWMVPTLGWRSMFIVGAIPAIVALLFRRFLPESPRWLATKGRLAEADSVVRDIESFVVRRGVALPPVPKMTGIAQTSNQTRILELVGRAYLGRTVMIGAVWFCTFFIVYSNATWLPTIYRTVFKLDVSTALLLGAANGVASLAAGFLGAMFVDIIGRRRWFAAAFAIGSLPLFAIWWLGAPSAWVVFYLSSLSYVFIGTMSTGTQLYTPELYPTRMRALATSFASVWARLASTIGPIIVGFMLADFNLASVFVMLGSFAVAGCLIMTFFGIETKDRVLEEISH
jgi:putative MFS transporter